MKKIFILFFLFYSVYANAQTIPSITNISPTSGVIGTTVTITGTNFNTTAANNIVYFGHTKASTPSAASSTSLTVTVPSGASLSQIFVLNTGTNLSCLSLAKFNPTFTPSKSSLSGSSFASALTLTTTGVYPFGAAIGDIDGDGKADYIVSNHLSGNSISIFRNTSTSGSISFAAKVDFATGSSPLGTAIGDVDGDGKLDVIVPNASVVSVFRNTSTSGSISFATKVDYATSTTAKYAAIGDLDGDGKPEIAVATNSTNVSVFLNNCSSGTISFGTKQDFTTAGSNLWGIAIGDLDGDSKNDIAVSNNNTQNMSTFRNTSSGVGNINFATRQDFSTGAGTTNPQGAEMADIDGDGKLDLVTGNYKINAICVLRNTSSSGTISFAGYTGFTSGGGGEGLQYATVGDITGDGKPDLIGANYNSNSVSVLRNTSSSGSVSFASEVAYTVGTNPRFVTVGDFDGDGRPDIGTTEYSTGKTASILMNNPPPTYYYSQGSGDPATLANWNSEALGGGSAPSNLTTSTTYYIQNGHTMTTTSALSFGASGSKLEVQSGGIFTASSGNPVTFASGSTLQVNAGGVFNSNTNQTVGTCAMVGGKVNIAAGTTLTINGVVSTTAGVFSGSSTSNLTIGTNVGSLLFDQTTPGTTNVIRNLIIGSGANASITLGNTLNIDPLGSVTFNAAGTKSLTTGGFLTLKSSALGTAYIGNTNSATISGNLSVERYLPATGRKFRFLASPVVGATSSNWRNNGVNTAGVGIQITGTGSNFDVSTTNASSAFSYNEVNAGSNTTVGSGASVDAGWTAFTDGNSTALTNGQGYRVLVRGDRTLSLTTSPAPAANATTISVTGSYPSSPVTINTTKTAANANSGYNLVGNPFPSAIDWNAITKTNVSGTYYIYSPSSSSYQSWNGSTGGATQYISSGQAFLVLNSSASGSISISESHKTTGTGGALFKGSLSNHLRIALKYDNSNSDEVFIHFRADATEGQDDFDAPKLINAAVNFASMGVDNKRYSINCLPALISDREVALSVLGSAQANYSIILNDVSTFEGYNVFLVDNYLHTSTQVNNGYIYPVQLTSDSASFIDGRFKIVFAKSATGLTTTVAAQRSIIAYPNPVDNVLNIDLNGTTSAAYTVFNQLGEVVLAGNFMQEKNALHTSNLSNGVYFIKVQNSTSAQTIKFVK